MSNLLEDLRFLASLEKIASLDPHCDTIKAAIAEIERLRAALLSIAEMDWPYSPGFVVPPPHAAPHRLYPREAIILCEMARKALGMEVPFVLKPHDAEAAQEEGTG